MLFCFSLSLYPSVRADGGRLPHSGVWLPIFHHSFAFVVWKKESLLGFTCSCFFMLVMGLHGRGCVRSGSILIALLWIKVAILRGTGAQHWTPAEAEATLLVLTLSNVWRAGGAVLHRTSTAWKLANLKRPYCRVPLSFSLVCGEATITEY